MNEFREKTSIIISHKIWAKQALDKILILKEGGILEQKCLNEN